MKKQISYILFALMFVLQLSGCNVKQNADGTNGQKDSADLESASGVLAIVGPDAKENSMDAYSAVVNTPLKVEAPAGAIEGGGSKTFLGASRAWFFKKHLFQDVDACWDELAFVTGKGEKGSEHFDIENQLWSVGPVAGTDHYVVFEYELQENQEDYRYFLTERDEAHEALRKIPLNFLNEVSLSEALTSLSDFAVDGSGMAHLVRQTEEGEQYLLVSPEGDTLAEYASEREQIRGLVPLYDGRVGFLSVTEQNGEAESIRRMTLQYMDAKTGKPLSLAAIKQDCYYFTLFDEGTLLYADSEGIYRSDLSGNTPELLYRWTNHGITAAGVSAMQVDKTGRIALLYQGFGDYNYLCLEPTTEEAEICEITMAVSSGRMSVYRPLAAAFNRQYPGYHIELESCDDKTALLTELTAGKGPVLIDTFLTGFEEQEKLWEPLDETLERLGIMEELQPCALELGRINGTLYGIVTDFRLRTLVTGDPDLKDWDYDSFLQCVEERPELEAIFNFYGGDYGTYFITNFISHGIDDTFLFDAEAGTMNFNSSKFRKALELAKKYCVREEGVSPGTAVLEGKVLCNELTVSKPEELTLYRVCYGEDANYIGYPTKDGAAHFAESGGSPLTIRKTAAREEKEAACAFISLCLSYEGQSQAAKDLNFALSVRKDLLEEQIAAMNKDTLASAAGFEQIVIGDDLNIELDRRILLDLVDQAKPLRYFPVELRNILYEELEQYFAGAITEDMVINNLESRVGLYLGERN